MPKQLTLSRKAIADLIIQPEVTSKQVYIQRYTAPVWPGGVSGITIGLGYDIGHVTPAQLMKDLSGIMPAHFIEELTHYCGMVGITCKRHVSGLKHIYLGWENACKLFYWTSLKKYARMACSVYPELETLHPYEQTAIVGLVYNRGTQLRGERRAEMLELVQAIKDDNDQMMGRLIRQMKRLWGQEQKGLRIRRDKEAFYIEMVDTPIDPSDELKFEV